jgi:hypothetical protein
MGQMMDQAKQPPASQPEPTKAPPPASNERPRLRRRVLLRFPLPLRIEPMMMPVSRSPHLAGDSPQAPLPSGLLPLVELRRSSAAQIRPLLPRMPYRGQRDRSAGTFPVSADHADSLNSPV